MKGRLSILLLCAYADSVWAPPGSYSGNIESDPGDSGEGWFIGLFGLFVMAKIVIPLAIKAYWAVQGQPYFIYEAHWRKEEFFNADWGWAFATIFALGILRSLL